MMLEIYPGPEGKEEDWKKYDPACERLDTAVKAIWLLYRRARWAALEELMGIPRSEMERIFGQFDMLYVASDHGRIRSESQVFSLLRMFNLEVEEVVNRRKKIVRKRKVNPLLAAAMQLVVDYQWMYRKARGKNGNTETTTAC
jgi:hypothetical protein